MTPIAPLLALGQIPTSVYEQAASSFRQGNLLQAEQTLRWALRDHPGEVRALGLMGVILDAQKRYDEAERYYNQAIKLNPRSASLLNNLGNHYLARGDSEPARAAYLKVVAVEPNHPNANLHLAQMSVATKNGETALRYLGRLPKGEQAAPSVELLRAQALDLTGRRSEAVSLLRQIEDQARRDPSAAFSVGMVYVDWKRYEDAEKAFTRALEADPTSFDVLYNLGLAATRAGHLDRAQEVFEIALKQRPDDVDTLVALARVNAEQGRDAQAVVLLARAERLAPDRADTVIFLARMTEKLGFYGDTAIAYDRYLKLRSHDDVARRERGFALARTAKVDEALQDLEWYVQKHPQDARGLYELAIAETVRERDKALQHLNQAIALDPKLLPARYARAVLLYQAGRPGESVHDLEIILKSEPDNYRALDILGQAFLAIDKPQEAANLLARAQELAPKDPKVLMHYGRALVKLGRKDEAESVLGAFRQLGSDQGRRRPHAGLLDYLNLPPTERRAKYLASLQTSINADPKDPQLKLRLGKALLLEGKKEEALKALHEALALTSDPTILAEGGRALLEANEYLLAREFLERAIAADPSSSEARLNLTIALFHTASPEAGLAEIDKTAAAKRNGDYFLLRAQLLDAMGKLEEAAETLNRGLRIAPTRPDLYLDSALFLIKHTRYEQALDVLRHASRILPDTPELLLSEAITLELLQRPDEALALLTQIQSRWPEWSQPYLVNGIMLEIRLKSAEAKPLLETAIALGARDAVAYYYLASAITHAAPEDTESAQKAIGEALRLTPDDAYIRSLAGKIAYARKDYRGALEHLNAAIRLWPDMVEARQTLSATYRALGEKQKSVAELQEILRIKQQNRTADPTPPFPIQNLLFAVRPPS